MVSLFEKKLTPAFDVAIGMNTTTTPAAAGEGAKPPEHLATLCFSWEFQQMSN